MSDDLRNADHEQSGPALESAHRQVSEGQQVENREPEEKIGPGGS
jgi:hypothetical protein